jgi:Na+-driven multidrug efflux pump
LSLKPKFLCFCKSLVKRALVLGAPSGTGSALQGVAVFFIIRALAGYGDVSVAAIGIVLKACLLLELVQQAIAVLPTLNLRFLAQAYKVVQVLAV